MTTEGISDIAAKLMSESVRQKALNLINQLLHTLTDEERSALDSWCDACGTYGKCWCYCDE